MSECQGTRQTLSWRTERPSPVTSRGLAQPVHALAFHTISLSPYQPPFIGTAHALLPGSPAQCKESRLLSVPSKKTDKPRCPGWSDGPNQAVHTDKPLCPNRVPRVNLCPVLLEVLSTVDGTARYPLGYWRRYSAHQVPPSATASGPCLGRSRYNTP